MQAATASADHERHDEPARPPAAACVAQTTQAPTHPLPESTADSFDELDDDLDEACYALGRQATQDQHAPRSDDEPDSCDELDEDALCELAHQATQEERRASAEHKRALDSSDEPCEDQILSELVCHTKHHAEDSVVAAPAPMVPVPHDLEALDKPTLIVLVRALDAQQRFLQQQLATSVSTAPQPAVAAVSQNGRAQRPHEPDYSDGSCDDEVQGSACSEAIVLCHRSERGREWR